MQEALSIAQETAMQQWDFQRTSRERQGEIPTLPGIGTYATRDGYVYSMVGRQAGRVVLAVERHRPRVQHHWASWCPSRNRLGLSPF